MYKKEYSGFLEKKVNSFVEAAENELKKVESSGNDYLLHNLQEIRRKSSYLFCVEDIYSLLTYIDRAMNFCKYQKGFSKIYNELDSLVYFLINLEKEAEKNGTS